MYLWCTLYPSYASVHPIMDLGPVPERLISANPGLKFCSTFYLLAYTLLGVTFFVIITVSQSKGSTVFSIVNLSYMFLDQETVLKMWLNLGLSFNIFRGTRPRVNTNIL